MGVFTNVIGCMGIPINNRDAETFDKRFVECTGCPATYNSRICHRAMKLHDLSLVFE